MTRYDGDNRLTVSICKPLFGMMLGFSYDARNRRTGWGTPWKP